MENQLKEFASIRKQGSQASNHEEAIRIIAKETGWKPKEVSNLVEYYFTRLLSKLMLMKKNINIYRLGRFAYKGLSKSKHEKFKKLQKKQTKTIVKL